MRTSGIAVAERNEPLRWINRAGADSGATERSCAQDARKAAETNRPMAKLAVRTGRCIWRGRDGMKDFSAAPAPAAGHTESYPRARPPGQCESGTHAL